jgi:hypothetical protein
LYHILHNTAPYKYVKFAKIIALCGLVNKGIYQTNQIKLLRKSGEAAPCDFCTLYVMRRRFITVMSCGMACIPRGSIVIKLMGGVTLWNPPLY